MKWGFRKSRGDRAASLLHRAIVEAVIYFKREGIPKSPSVAHQKTQTHPGANRTTGVLGNSSRWCLMALYDKVDSQAIL
jgi:hypothetical protein